MHRCVTPLLTASGCTTCIIAQPAPAQDVTGIRGCSTGSPTALPYERTDSKGANTQSKKAREHTGKVQPTPRVAGKVSIIYAWLTCMLAVDRVRRHGSRAQRAMTRSMPSPPGRHRLPRQAKAAASSVAATRSTTRQLKTKVKPPLARVGPSSESASPAGVQAAGREPQVSVRLGHLLAARPVPSLTCDCMAHCLPCDRVLAVQRLCAASAGSNDDDDDDDILDEFRFDNLVEALRALRGRAGPVTDVRTASEMAKTADEIASLVERGVGSRSSQTRSWQQHWRLLRKRPTMQQPS